MVNKKVVIISTIIALVVVAGIVGLAIRRNNDYTYTDENIEKNNSKNSSVVDNKVAENKVAENKVPENKVENTVVENKVSENKTSENKTENNSSNKDSSNTQTNSSNLRDIAISLAKKEWGEDNSVYYSVEDGNSKDEYIVSIRDPNTTAEIVSYTINVKNKTVKEN